MATRSAGRVTIRVIPDSTGFRRDLRTALDRIEKVTRVHIPAELSVTRESIRELRRQLADLEVKIKVEPYITQERLRELQEQVENLNPQLDIGLNSALARARLAVLTRPRIVELFVKVNQASLVSAATTLAALSGARVLSNTFDKFWDAIKNLDKNAPRIGAIATGINTLAGSILALTSNLAGLAGSFAQLGQISVLLPALFSAAAINIGVLIAAFKDMKTVLADLGPEFSNLQDIISSRFWSEAAQPIRDLTYNLLPTLRDTLGALAGAWGRLFAELSRSLQTEVTPDRLAFMMGNLTRSVEVASRAMAPLVSAFTRLGMFGSQYLPRLSEWFVKLSEDFNTFITDAANDGKLDLWAERGIEAFKDLGRVLKETVRVFAALTRAADAAGGAGFDQLADGLRRLADTMNTDAFQTTLATIFRGAHSLMDGLIRGLDRLGAGLADFAPTLEGVFTASGLIIEAFLQNISLILQDPQFQRGMDMFFDGFLSFMRALEPAAGPLGQIVGLLAEAAGVMLQAFGPVVADAIILLAPIFEELWDALKPLIPTLSELLRELLPPFAEILLVIAQEVLPELIPIIKELAPIFVDILKALAPVIVEWLKDFAEALRVGGPYIRDAAAWLGDLTDAFNGLPKAFYESSTGDMGGFIGTIGKLFADNPALPAQILAFSSALGGLSEMGEGLITFAESIERMGEAIGGLVAAFTTPEGIITLLANVVIGFNAVTGLLPGWEGFWPAVGAAITSVLPQFEISPYTNGIVTAFGVVTAFLTPWTVFWDALPPPVRTALETIGTILTPKPPAWIALFSGFFVQLTPLWTNFWQTTLPVIVPPAMNVINAGIQGGFPGMVVSVMGGMSRLFDNFDRGWQTIKNALPGWFRDIIGGVGQGILEVVAKSDTLPGQMLRGLQNVVGFFTAGYQMIADFAAGIEAGVGLATTAIEMVIAAVTGRLPGSPAKYGPLSGQGYSLIRGQHLMEDFASGMRSRTDDVKNAALDAARAASINGTGASFASVQSVAGVESSRALVEIKGDYYGATPERVARDLSNRVRRQSIAYSLRSVGK